jgi:TolB-like protein/Tfp pilus assembly protein PilF
MSLFDELKRRKVFKVGAGYLVVAWLAVQAASIGFPAFDAPPWALRIFILVIFLGFPISLVFAWAFDVTPEGLKAEGGVRNSKGFLLIAAGLAALAFAWYFKGQPAYLDAANPAVATSPAGTAATPAKPSAPISKKSIAVLPFVNMSADKDQEYFSDGIAEEILNALAQVKDLKVAGRTSSFQFKGKSDDLRAVGQALGVAHILEGSVRKQGDKVRITAQLVQTEDGFHVWSETYDGDLKDVFTLQENIARSITDKLQVILQGEQSQRLVEAPTQNTEAYTLYLQATQVFNRRDGVRFPTAIQQLGRALQLDPKFARAHARLASIEAVAANYDPGVRESAATAVEEHARKAMQLDPRLAEPHAALGALYTRNRRYIEAFETLERALALDANDVTAKFWYATLMCTTGYLAKCGAELDGVLEIDPMMPNALSWRGRELVRTREFDKAELLLRRSEEVGLAHAGLGLGALADARGNGAEAERYWALGNRPFLNDFPAGSAEILANGIYGDAPAKAKAIGVIDQYLASNPATISAVAINALMRLGQPQRALALAERGITSNEAIVLMPLWENRGQSARKIPEFAGFARSIGLASLWDALGPPDLCAKNAKGDYVCR